MGCCQSSYSKKDVIFGQLIEFFRTPLLADLVNLDDRLPEKIVVQSVRLKDGVTWECLDGLY